MTSSSVTRWTEVSLSERLRIIKMARYRIASTSTSFADAISPELQRTSADTLVAEVLPLLAACKFLEQEATRVLETRKLGRRGLPFWLFGLANEGHCHGEQM